MKYIKCTELGLNVSQIGPKWDESDHFSRSYLVHFGSASCRHIRVVG